MNRIRSFKLVLLALIATVVSTGLLSARDYKCKFTLPFEAKWGRATLPAVSYHRVAAMTANKRVVPYLVLGHALAHEIGHLLLGRNGHAPSGLMRAAWTDTDLHSAALGHLNFSPEEAVAIRAGVRDRLGYQEVTKAAPGAAEMALLAAN